MQRQRCGEAAGWLVVAHHASVPMSNLRVTIHGCRGSIPVCGEDYVRFGGETSCMVIRAGDREIVLDAGSGLTSHSSAVVARYVETQTPIETHLFISHAHLDHLIGLPYYAPLYMADATVSIWGPRNGRFDSFGQTIDAFIAPPFFPVPLYEMQAELRFADFGETETVYFLKGEREPVQLRARHPSDADRIPKAVDVELEVQCMRGYNHPKSGVNIYKVIAGDRSLVYATDTEGYVHGDRRLCAFAAGADILIHDAMYTEDRYVSMPAPTQGYGHSTVDIATRLAADAGVGQLVLFHHDPGSNDEALAAMEAQAKKLFGRTTVARDGLEIEL